MLILDYSNLNNKCIHPIFQAFLEKKAEKCLCMTSKTEIPSAYELKFKTKH